MRAPGEQQKTRATLRYAGSVTAYFFVRGADARNRTGDLHITNVLLYQLSYIGEDQHSSKELPKLASAKPILLKNHPSAW